VEVMRCTACGAELILTNVVPDDTVAVRGVENHTFICSACHVTEHRVVFIKAGRETDGPPINEGQNDGYERTSVPCRTPIYARVCVPGVEPVLPGPRSVIGRSYSARLALLVVWGAGEAVVFATSVTILLTP
jgi:hypothetical protein